MKWAPTLALAVLASATFASFSSAGPLGTADPPLMVQLASLDSRTAAERSWEGMRRRIPKLLGPMELSLQEAKVEGRGTFYRVQTGPFPNFITALDFCTAVRQEGLDCIVVERSR